MTEIASRNDAFTAPQGPFAGTPRPLTTRPNQLSGSDHFDRMSRWLELFIATEQVASVLARTAFVPEPMRGQPENIAAAMMKSLELGIDPLDGLSCIHVVKGKIGFSAEFMRRRIIEAGHEIVIDESTDSRCKIRGRRAGSTEWQTVTFTDEQARKAKINLGDYPADKLVARASSRLCRRVFPDVLAGTTIVDDIDDNVDVIDESGASVQRKRKPRKAAAPAAAVKPQSGGDIDELLDNEDEDSGDASEQDDVAAEPAEPTDDAQIPADARVRLNRKMHALFREAGLEKDRRDDRITITRYIAKRFDIDTSNGLTLDELENVAETLSTWKRDGVLDEKINDLLNQAAIDQAQETS